MTPRSEVAASAESGVHAVTRFHAEVRVLRSSGVPSGSMTDVRWYCTHHHLSRLAASACSQFLERLLLSDPPVEPAWASTTAPYGCRP